jgi:chromosome segregation ATPase
MNGGNRFFGLDKNWWKSKAARELDGAKGRLKSAEAKLAEERAELARSTAKLNAAEAQLRDANGRLDRALDEYAVVVIEGWDLRGTKDQIDAYAADVRAQLKRYTGKVRPETLQAFMSKVSAIDADLYRAIASE